MPVFQLTDELIFPPPELAEPDGLLAVGGDLSPRRLLLAYAMGIFPWYSEDQPILWWSPDPRLVLFPDELKISRSLRQTMKKGLYTVTVDTAFDRIITACAEVHRKQDEGTWITQEIKKAYIELHHLGHAHSVEVWHENRLVGGLYGVAMGGAFSGESMFALMSDASKVAMVRLVEELQGRGFGVIDCQVTTPHLVSLGAREIPRSEYLDILSQELQKSIPPARWE